MQTTEEVVAISDPGEVGREHHNRGDRFIVVASNVAAWLFPFLMIAICSQVVLRYIGMNQAWLDDFQWWLYGAAALVGVGYAVTTNSHVRVDILYDGFPSAKKTRIDLFGLGWLFLPFIILCWDVTFSYTLTSIGTDEGSSSPNGLHNVWILKVFMNLSFIFMGVACWAAIYRNLAKLTPPAPWKMMLAALPATMFLVNLAIYYALWIGVYLTSPAGTKTRQIGRSVVFDDVEIGPYDIKYTVMATVVLSIVVIGIARAIDRRGHEG